jgi:hypothetical protein
LGGGDLSLRCVLRGSLRSHLRMREVGAAIPASALAFSASRHRFWSRRTALRVLIPRCERSEPRRTHDGRVAYWTRRRKSVVDKRFRAWTVSCLSPISAPLGIGPETGMNPACCLCDTGPKQNMPRSAQPTKLSDNRRVLNALVTTPVQRLPRDISG